MNLSMPSTSTTKTRKSGSGWHRFQLLDAVRLLLSLLVPLTLVAEANAQFSYVVNSGSTSVTVTGYTGPETTVTIPSTMNVSGTSLPVTSIGNDWWPEGSIIIGGPNFSSLTSVTIPNSVTNIGKFAFDECSGLVSVTIPNSVTNIGMHAFSCCTGLTSVTIPGSVTKIGEYAFSSCTSLTSVTIPGSVTNIGKGMFSGCTSLTSLTIPSSVTSICLSAFDGCTSLSSIIVDATNFAYSSADGVLFDKSQATIIKYPLGNSADYVIPNSVTDIGNYAFSGCTGLTRVTIPNSVTSIGMYAFSDCSGLTSVTIPNSVTSFENHAFSGCSSLTSVTIPTSVTSIANFAFESCTSLTSLTIPNSVTSIEDCAFEFCTSLTSVTIPNSVTSIEDCAFWGCSSMTRLNFTGNAPMTIGVGVFYCTASDFTVYYYNDKMGFTSPTWNGYPSVNMGDSSPAVASWLSTHGLPATINLHSAPNGDGVSLLMAYALNLDPTQNQSGSIPQPVLSGSSMSLSYYAGSAGVTYTVQVSTDLQTWTTTGVTVSAPDANNIRTATAPVTSPRCFMRLVLTH